MSLHMRHEFLALGANPSMYPRTSLATDLEGVAVGSGRFQNQQIGVADCKHGFGGADDAHRGILRTPARRDTNDRGRLTPIDDRVIVRVLYPRANHKEGS